MPIIDTSDLIQKNKNILSDDEEELQLDEDEDQQNIVQKVISRDQLKKPKYSTPSKIKDSK